MKKYIFTSSEKEAVKAAVRELETQSCGEIVPFFARSSDDYEEVGWQLSALCGLTGLVITAFLAFTWNLPGLEVIEICVILIGFMTLGYLLPVVFPIIKRILTSKERMQEAVDQAAREAFLLEKVYATQEQVGILIYVSRLEHLVVVLGDEGINQKVNPEDWNQVISLVVQGLQKKKIGEGLVNGIEHCKKLLLDHGFVRKDTDHNELSDELRIKS
ncbi:MAG: hypothetical protein AAF616_05170 [Bacteroidota bacterium]